MPRQMLRTHTKDAIHACYGGNACLINIAACDGYASVWLVELIGWSYML